MNGIMFFNFIFDFEVSNFQIFFGSTEMFRFYSDFDFIVITQSKRFVKKSKCYIRKSNRFVLVFQTPKSKHQFCFSDK